MNSVQFTQFLPDEVTNADRKPPAKALAWAYASGDPRMAAKQYDRPGLSRGAAQWNQAGIDSAQRMAEGVAQAYSQNIQDQAYKSRALLEGQKSQEQSAQALAGLQQQSDYAEQMAGLQRQQMMNNLLGGLFQGLFNI